MSELQAPPGTIVAKGRQILALNWAGQWLAPGALNSMPAPDAEGWSVVRWGAQPIECDECFALVPGDRWTAHDQWHDQKWPRSES